MIYDNEIGDLCLESFNKLGKSGKPNPQNEYTVLAAIVCDYKSNRNDGQQREVVALSTGTKCFPSNECIKNERIVDSHSESLLKRAFKRHLISRLNSGFQLDDISAVSLFVSQLPCGTIQRWQGDSNDNSLVQSSASNRKPGRGETCVRATCLMKITKWVFMGLQGKALIKLTKRPIYMTNIVIGNCGPIGEYNQQIVDKWFILGDNCIAYNPFDLKNLPKIKFCEKFRNNLFVKSNSNHSTATSIVMWLTGDGQTTEVLTEGRKLGATNKNRLKNQVLSTDSCINRDIDLLKNERDVKLCQIYENQWNELKKCRLFGGWHSLNH